MPQVTYKIYIPFQFIIGNAFYKTNLTISEFDINDVHVKMQLDGNGDKEKSYLVAITSVKEDGIHFLEDIADVKIGNTIQSFFDGISKALSNAAFFNVYNGNEFVVEYEMYYEGRGSKTPYRDNNKGYYLDDDLVNKAITFANSENEFLRQAFLYLKEGEYLVDIGRFSNAIIQFAVMIEYLINYQLKKHNLLDNNGNYIEPFKSECNDMWKKLGNRYGVSFSFSRYVYGFSKLNLKMDHVLVDTIDSIYRLRNKLAHGYSLFDAFEICDTTYGTEKLSPYNVWDCMMVISNYMTDVYNFFVDNFNK